LSLQQARLSIPFKFNLKGGVALAKSCAETRRVAAIVVKTIPEEGSSQQSIKYSAAKALVYICK